MTPDKYREYIQQHLLAQAASKYKHDEHLQLVYQIGFLQQQLAEAMCRDTHTYLAFRQQVNR